MQSKIGTFLSELTKSNQTLSKTKQLHALITKTHLSHDPFYATKLVRLYAQNNDLASARHLFDKTSQRSVFLWNSIIRAYAKSHSLADAFFLYGKMLEVETTPDEFTYACLIRGCYETCDLERVRVLHGRVVVSGLGLDSVCCSALVTAYSKLRLLFEARQVFSGVFEPDLVLWNAVISGCSSCGEWYEGMRLFNEMQRGGKQELDGYTLVGVMSGLVDSSLIEIGEGIHGLCLKKGFDCNAHIGSALVSMYSRFRCMNSAYDVFCSISEPDLVTWSALISGYSQCGDYEKALFLFRNLNVHGKKADPVLITSALVVTAQSANVCLGSEIHGYAIRNGFEFNVKVSSALIDMYSKCGFVRLGTLVFENMPNRNVISYNSMISGLGLHGLASQAFKTFDKMLAEGLEPDESTFSALLSACSHAGLVEDGWEIFRRMKDEFCIKARTEHYIDIVKLFGMAGELEEAYEFILSLKQPVDSSIWGALLSCCNAHHNTELAEIAAQHLFVNEPKKGAYRVMLSNIYASDGRWDDVKKMRENIEVPEVWKIPGLSWVGGSCS